eukprot:PhM_4_TR14215/c0_g1_i4/m.101406
MNSEDAFSGIPVVTVDGDDRALRAPSVDAAETDDVDDDLRDRRAERDARCSIYMTPAMLRTDNLPEGANPWDRIFANFFDAEVANKYAAEFHRQCLPVDNPPLLSDFNYHEMKIRMGHRRLISEMLTKMRASHIDDHGPSASYGRPDTNAVVSSRFNEFSFGEDDSCELVSSTHNLSSGFEWTDYEGTAESYEAFLQTVATNILARQSPDAIPASFERAFWLNKSMPFLQKGNTAMGRPCLVLLLRLPSIELVEDPLHIRSNTMESMTNRLVLIFVERSKQRGRLITYHKDTTDEIAWMRHLKDTWARDRRAAMTREALIFHIITRAGETNRAILDAFARQLEYLVERPVSHAPTSVVAGMSLINRQAQVLKRCLAANAAAVERLAATLGSEGQSAVQVLRDLSTAAEEIESGAMDAMNLRMGLVGFRSQENMRLFTYISAVTAPLSVMTGWYGMNFEHMPELGEQSAYAIFAAFAGTVAVGMILLMKWLHREKQNVPITNTDSNLLPRFDDDVDEPVVGGNGAVRKSHQDVGEDVELTTHRMPSFLVVRKRSSTRSQDPMQK